jgi:hypothetical protein
VASSGGLVHEERLLGRAHVGVEDELERITAMGERPTTVLRLVSRHRHRHLGIGQRLPGVTTARSHLAGVPRDVVLRLMRR